MMRRLFIAAVLGALLSAPAALATPPDYSADMVMRSSEGSVNGKIYASGQLLRYEMDSAVTITRLDRKKSYVLMPSEKMYMENPIDPLAGAKAGVQPEGDVARESLGMEPFDGRNVEKVKVTYSDANGTSVIYQWLDSDGIPVKVEAEDGSWAVEYRNKVAAPQPAELFEVPADYQAFAMPDISKLLESGVQ